jgi:non-lysosomal glucosylceramidase
MSHLKKIKRAVSSIDYPRHFSGDHLSRIAFPLGGIGTGGMELGGRGDLRSWQIFNRAADREIQQYIFPRSS